MSPEFQRAQLLAQQRRYDMAVEVLHQMLLTDPRDAHAHALLAYCYSVQSKHDDAQREVEQAIVFEPDDAYLHYVRASVLLKRNNLKEAEKSAREAIRLYPVDADYYDGLATALLAQEKWQAAYDAATQGLEFDPEHADCLNSRAIALTKLGRQSEAIESVDQTLANDPDNALAHANKGWALLHQRDSKQALGYFRESLRLDPHSDYAKRGMVEAIKSQNFLYRWINVYFLWMSRQSGSFQWGFILFGYFGIRFLRSLARDNPDFESWVFPIIIVYFCFAMLTWFAMPLSNLILRLSRFGRYALSRDQRVASNWLVACMMMFLIGVAAIYAWDMLAGVFMAFAAFGMALPLVTIYNCEPGWPRKIMSALTIFMAVVGAAMVPAVYMREDFAVTLGWTFAICFIATPWIANVLTRMSPVR